MKLSRLHLGACILLAPTILFAQSNPPNAQTLHLEAGEQVLDYDVSNDSKSTWIIVKNGQSFTLKQWQFDNPQVRTFVPPAQTNLQAVAIHPADNRVFLMARNAAGLYKIERLDTQSTQWTTQVIYQSNKPLRRLMVSAAKLSPSYIQGQSARVAHRIYFAQNAGKGWTTYSVRDDGSVPYSLIGSDIIAAKKENGDGGAPFQKQQASTLPASLHPSGLALLLQDDKSCFFQLNYVVTDWALNKDNAKPICGGFLAWTRNGLFLQHWRKDTLGVTLYSTISDKKFTLLDDTTVLSPPSSLPDGRHLLVLTEDAAKQQHLQKVAVNIPAGDIMNAWMFVQNQEETDVIAKNGGAFRPIDWSSWMTPQMYSIYDSEAYQCEAGSRYAKRPYLVSTDLFWENIAAAYEGLFILHERHTIVPALDRFLEQAANHFANNNNDSTFAKIIYTSAVVRNKNSLSKVPMNLRKVVKAEAQLIENAAGSEISKVTGMNIDYSEFTPRGHYEKSDNSARYFRTVRYLASQKLANESLDEIKKLPANVNAAAVAWATAYDKLIAEARSPLAWNGSTKATAHYARETQDQASLFPLSWGFDNEVFHNTTYRQHWPKDLQISPNQPRVLPSGLDLAAVLGSDLALQQLQAEFKRHPQLAKRIDALRQQAATAIKPEANLYHAWINALATEFATPPDTIPAESRDLWQSKRLQTGLTSWATLRHATVLVNDLAGAQGGQGGFEFERVIHPEPRGAVEPDPKAFETMAGLLAQIAQYTEQTATTWPKTKTVQEMSKAYVKRMQGEAALMRQLADMAKRQNQGKDLSAKEYALIEKIGASAEHDFLLFKSVHHEEGAVYIPDPISKIADVANSNGKRLLAAVGKPLEWNQSIGKAGARQLMRAAVYSYYEFHADAPMSDSKWRDAEEQAVRPAWVQKYLLNKTLECPKLR